MFTHVSCKRQWWIREEEWASDRKYQISIAIMWVHFTLNFHCGYLRQMSSSSEEKSSTLPAVPRARVSANTIGGFKNRSDLGSREERRSKDGDELSHKHSTEDDERDELAFHVVDTTITNAIEELAATTLFEGKLENY